MQDTITIVTGREADPETHRAAEAVFWETAYTAQFDSPRERDAFERRYFSYYRELAPELFLIARDAEGATLGYICAVADTRAHRELYALAAHVPLFDDLYTDYPSHLHINLTARARGRGVGGLLIADLEQRLLAAGSTGLHLVTSPGARNVRFYHRNGFTDAVERELNDQEGTVALLFLGKPLSSAPSAYSNDMRGKR